MLKKTPLYEAHQAAGAKLVDFSGWLMPLHYGSQIEEHHQVRKDAGMFDVSHMAVVQVEGKDALPYLRHLVANDVAKLKKDGQALYTCMLNHEGGIVDDLIVYRLSDQLYRLVLNAGTRAKDFAWLLEQKATYQVELTARDELAMIAVQGPHATSKLITLLPEPLQSALQALSPFQGFLHDDVFYSRTGYTGEDGFEIQLPAKAAVALWEDLRNSGVAPCGLGARDTLRLEAGLNLYGIDMDETTTPFESNLAWTVALEPFDRVFIGRSALEKQKGTKHAELVGLVLDVPGVLRGHQHVLIPELGEGEITSGTFSPTLGKAVALARLPSGAIKRDECDVMIRERVVKAHIVKPPFVRLGKKVYRVQAQTVSE